MGGKRRTIRLIHLIRISGSAVISARPPIDKILSTTLPKQVSTASTAETAASNTPVWPTMSQLAKFKNNHIIFAAVQTGQQLIGNFIGAHFRFQVVSRHLGRSNQRPILVFTGSLYSAVEEKGYMGILFPFRRSAVESGHDPKYTGQRYLPETGV